MTVSGAGDLTASWLSDALGTRVAAVRTEPVGTGQVSDSLRLHLTYADEHKTVAETGWWEEESRDDHRIVFVLHGGSGARRYALIRTDRDWLLHLVKDQPPR